MTNSIERSDAIKHDNEKEEATTKTRAELSQEAIEDAIKQLEAMRVPSGVLLGVNMKRTEQQMKSHYAGLQREMEDFLIKLGNERDPDGKHVLLPYSEMDKMVDGFEGVMKALRSGLGNYYNR